MVKSMEVIQALEVTHTVMDMVIPTVGKTKDFLFVELVIILFIAQ